MFYTPKVRRKKDEFKEALGLSTNRKQNRGTKHIIVAIVCPYKAYYKDIFAPLRYSIGDSPVRCLK